MRTIDSSYSDRTVTLQGYNGNMLQITNNTSSYSEVAFLTPLGARQLIAALEPFAAPRPAEPQPEPQPEPPLVGVEWLTGRAPAADDGRYEVVFSYHGAPFVRSGNANTDGSYPKAEAERRARNEQRAMGNDPKQYRYSIRRARA